jgi:choline dehydrogenase
VLPHFKRHEDHHGGADAMHGAGNEWRVEAQRLSWKILDAFQAAAASVGIPPTRDFNRGNNFGCGYFEVNQKRGMRWNAAQAFLQPVRSRPNLAVFTGTCATRLVFDAGRCTGVEVERAGARARISASAEVLLAAGAVATPQLLQLSGVGPGERLQHLGIEVHHALAGVGANLQDHLQLRMAFRLSGVRTLNTLAASWWSKAGMAIQYALFRRGPLTMSPSQLGAFAHSSPEVTRPDLEYHVQPLSLERFGEPLHPFDAFTTSVCHLRPQSRGSVSLRSPHPHDAPLIEPNYLSTAHDRTVAAAALRLTRRIVAAPPLAPFCPTELKPGAGSETDEELARAAGDIGTTIFHPVGTAKMGPRGDPAAVVDADLRVHGVAGLRVIDASVMPTITSGNTNAPTLMIAEKGAALVAAALGAA